MTAFMTTTQSQFRGSTTEVETFMKSVGLDPKSNKDLIACDRILGFMSAGRSAERWLINGIPPYVHTLMAYVSMFGSDLAERLAQKRDGIVAKAEEAYVKTNYYKTRAIKASEFKVPAMRILDWRLKHKLSQPMLDRTFGLTSRGRSCRLWEENGAPPYVEFFMAYVDEYGIDLADKLVEERGQKIPKTARGAT